MTEEPKQGAPPSDQPEGKTAETPLAREISQEELQEILAQHLKWVETGGKEGKPADLEKANLKQADLRGADLTGATNLIQGQLNQACVDENTKLPKGLTRPKPCSEEDLGQK